MIKPTGVIDPISPKTYADETATTARVSTIKLAGEPEWVKTNHTGGLKHLPIRVTMQRTP